MICVECEKGRHTHCEGATPDDENFTGLVECECVCGEATDSEATDA
ncbi:MAG: hypothetical protein ACRDMV_25250 [Streptosporangiales bacterium]